MLNLNDLSPRSSLSPVVLCACSYSPFISQMKKYLPNLHWGNNGLFFNRSYTRPLNYDQLYLLETRKMKRHPACSSHRERLFNLLRSWIFHSRSLAIPLCLHLWSHTNHRKNGFCRWIDRADFILSQNYPHSRGLALSAHSIGVGIGLCLGMGLGAALFEVLGYFGVFSLSPLFSCFLLFWSLFSKRAIKTSIGTPTQFCLDAPYLKYDEWA